MTLISRHAWYSFLRPLQCTSYVNLSDSRYRNTQVMACTVTSNVSEQNLWLNRWAAYILSMPPSWTSPLNSKSAFWPVNFWNFSYSVVDRIRGSSVSAIRRPEWPLYLSIDLRWWARVVGLDELLCNGSFSDCLMHCLLRFPYGGHHRGLSWAQRQSPWWGRRLRKWQRRGRERQQFGFVR